MSEYKVYGADRALTVNAKSSVDAIQEYASLLYHDGYLYDKHPVKLHRVNEAEFVNKFGNPDEWLNVINLGTKNHKEYKVHYKFVTKKDELHVYYTED